MFGFFFEKGTNIVDVFIGAEDVDGHVWGCPGNVAEDKPEILMSAALYNYYGVLCLFWRSIALPARCEFVGVVLL